MALDSDGREWTPTTVTLVRALAILGVLAVLRSALSPWSFNSVGIEVPGFAEGLVLVFVGTVAVVIGPRHPLGAALAVVGGVRGGLPAWREIAKSLGGEMWFDGFVWMGIGALLLLVAGVVSGVVVLRRWTGGRDEPTGEHGEPAGERSDEPVGERSDVS